MDDALTADAVTANRRQLQALLASSFLLVLVPVALVLLLFGLGLVGLLVALVVAAGVVAGCWWTAEGMVLRRSGARPLTPDDHPRLHNVVEGLCVANGVAKPALYVIDDAAPNAFVVGRSAEHASLAVTQGLLEIMNRVELEAVIAHELSRIKDDDVVVDTLAVTLPVTARLVHLVMGRGREPRTDMAAVAMTRFPPALASALVKMRDGGTAVQTSSWATAHLWIAAARSGSEVRDPSVEDARFDDHQPLDQRIALLQEL